MEFPKGAITQPLRGEYTSLEDFHINPRSRQTFRERGLKACYRLRFDNLEVLVTESY